MPPISDRRALWRYVAVVGATLPLNPIVILLALIIGESAFVFAYVAGLLACVPWLVQVLYRKNEWAIVGIVFYLVPLFVFVHLLTIGTAAWWLSAALGLEPRMD